jgi:hypothetical protein
MSTIVNDTEAYVLAAAKAIGMPIAPEHLAGVVMNFQRTAQFAALVNAFALSESLEPAAVFRLPEVEGEKAGDEA